MQNTERRDYAALPLLFEKATERLNYNGHHISSLSRGGVGSQLHRIFFLTVSDQPMTPLTIPHSGLPLRHLNPLPGLADHSTIQKIWVAKL